MGAVGGKNQNDVSAVITRVDDLELSVNALDEDILEIEKATFKTGDIKPLWGVVPDLGWIAALDNHICKTDQGGDYGDEVKALYLHLWALLAATGSADNWFYIDGLTKGVSALADWEADVKLYLNVKDFTRYADESEPGKWYTDTFQGHYHEAQKWNAGTYDDVIGNGNDPTGEYADNLIRAAVTDGINGTPRTGSETQPKHARVKPQIKL